MMIALVVMETRDRHYRSQNQYAKRHEVKEAAGQNKNQGDGAP